MSYANGTTNYNLPQTVGTDKRDWSDTNQAFADIDAALKAAADGASQAAEDITSLTTRVGTAEDDIVGLKAEDISLDGRLDTAEGAISTLQLQVPDVRGDLEDMIVAFNEATATSTHAYAIDDYFIYNDVLYKATASIAIGDTIVPNTNCSATNVMTEIEAGAAAPTAADVSLAPITGMTADDVQEGIAELKTDISKHTVAALVTITASNYNDTSHLYTVPYDGYLTIHSRSVNNERIQVNDENSNELISARGDGTYGSGRTLFVRKGMQIYFASENFTGPTVTIRELS